MKPDGIAATILALERAALDRWGEGDPSGYLEISAPDVRYFDPFLKSRIDGDAFTTHYEPIRGAIRIDSDEIVEPAVDVRGDVAVLTFDYVSFNDGFPMRWNATEVYRRDGDLWQIVHTHWSITERLADNSG